MALRVAEVVNNIIARQIIADVSVMPATITKAGEATLAIRFGPAIAAKPESSVNVFDDSPDVEPG